MDTFMWRESLVQKDFLIDGMKIRLQPVKTNMMLKLSHEKRHR